MGDLPPDSRSQPGDLTAGPTHADHQHGSLPKARDNNTPFYSQLSSIPHEQIHSEHRPSTYSPQYYPTQQHGTSAFAMGSMAGALPEHPSDAASVNHQASQYVPRSVSGASTSALVYQLGQNLQMPAHPPGGVATHASYRPNFGVNLYTTGFVPSPNAQHSVFSPYPSNQARLPGGLLMHNPYQQYQPSQYMYYPTHYAPQGQHSAVGYLPQNPQGTTYGRNDGSTAASYAIPGQNMVLPHYEGCYAGVRTEAADPVSMGATYSSAFHPVQGKSIIRPSRHHQDLTDCLSYRCISLGIYKFHTSRPASKTQTVRTCSVGRKSPTGKHGGSPQGTLFTRSDQGH
jgi:hypothetical protein